MIRVLSLTQQYIALVANSFGHYGHHQANAIQNLKRLITCSAKIVKLYGITFTLMLIFISVSCHQEYSWG